MISRLPTLLAALTLVGLLAWIRYTTLDGAAVPPTPAEGPTALVLQERAGGSEVPCDVPMAWRVTRVDPSFGISPEVATAVLSEAAALWESGTGRALFIHDPDDGFPIRLVYDDRQARLEERGSRSEEVEAVRAGLEADRTALDVRAAGHRAEMQDYAARIADLDRRVGEHNEAVRTWNESRDRSDERWQALEAAAAVLERERVRLVAERPRLDEEQNALLAAERALNLRISEYDAMAGELEADLPPEGVEAGIYREAVSRQGTDVVSVSREIRLYRFADADELRLLAAHELGHALGLGHIDDEGSVMSASARADRLVSALSNEDRRLFEAVCPAGAPDR